MRVLARIALDWATRCFGQEHVTNFAIRALRIVEEAIELCQALGVPKDKVALCVEKVYERPVGDAEQEIGGVLLTVHILCESMGHAGDELFERELRRVLKKPVREMTQRNQDKIMLGLDARSKCVVTTHTDQDGCKISRPQDWDHRTVGPVAAFFSLCSRPDHTCAAIGEGPCNGLPQPFTWASEGERIHADRMWRNKAFRFEFDATYREHGFTTMTGPDYESRFNSWAAAQVRKGRRAP